MKALCALKQKLAAAAQQVYDEWQPSDDLYDDALNGGGICDQIADAFCEVLEREGMPAKTVSTTVTPAGVHVFTAFQAGPGNYLSADIPYFVYERGGGYSWKKIEGVFFTPEDVQIDTLPWTEEDWESDDW